LLAGKHSGNVKKMFNFGFGTPDSGPVKDQEFSVDIKPSKFSNTHEGSWNTQVKTYKVRSRKNTFDVDENFAGGVGRNHNENPLAFSPINDPENIIFKT
jgi:hypothetical protein